MPLIKLIIILTLLFSVSVIADEIPSTSERNFGQCHTLDKTKRLLGTWRSVDSKSTYTETWQQISKDTYEGNAVSIVNQVKSVESLRLVKMLDGIYYLAKIKTNKYPIPFKLSYCSSTQLRFTNPTHDFPQTLQYVFSQGDQLSIKVFSKSNTGFTLTLKK